MPSVYENWSWPYQQALSWMRVAKEHCLLSGEMALGVGSHDAPLITLGRHADLSEILDADYLRLKKVEVFHIDRGGGATFHGPGQVVLYPVTNLQALQITVPEFTALLERAMIDTLKVFDIAAQLTSGEPGVFVDGAKIGSIGMRISQSVVTHGISLNINNSLAYYSRFRPCKKDDARVTSMKELGVARSVEEVGMALVAHFNHRINEYRH